MKSSKAIQLVDWLTSEKVPFASKLTSSGDRVLHSHSFIEFFYVTKGASRHQINEEIEQIVTGDIEFLSLNDEHSFLREEEDELEHRDIVIRASFFEEICGCISSTLFQEFSEGKIRRKLNLSTNQIKEMESKLSLIDQLLLNDVERAITMIRIFLFDLLGFFYSSTLQKSDDAYPDWFKELMERFADLDLLRGGLPEITKPFYFTNEHICRTFHKYTGMTMTDYLTQRRVFEAANMLIYSNLSVAEICSSLGLTSASYFNKVFKNQYHTTPLQFRKKSLNKLENID